MGGERWEPKETAEQGMAFISQLEAPMEGGLSNVPDQAVESSSGAFLRDQGNQQ